MWREGEGCQSQLVWGGPTQTATLLHPLGPLDFPRVSPALWMVRHDRWITTGHRGYVWVLMGTPRADLRQVAPAGQQTDQRPPDDERVGETHSNEAPAADDEEPALTERGADGPDHLRRRAPARPSRGRSALIGRRALAPRDTPRVQERPGSRNRRGPAPRRLWSPVNRRTRHR